MHRLQKRNERLKETISQLAQQSGVSVDGTFHGDFVAIMEEFNDHVREKTTEGTFQRMFWDQQLQASKLGDSRQMKWHPSMIRWCLYLKLSSGGAYTTLRDSGVLKLPSERTLRDYTHHIPPATGFQEEVFEELKSDAKLEQLEEWQKFVAVSFDEMKIKEGLVYDKHSDNLVGFVALGDITDHLLEVERQCDSVLGSSLHPPVLATHIFLIFIRGIFFHLNFPLAQFPSHGIAAYQLYPIVTEAIMRLELHGFKVISLTSNGAASNRKLYQMMHVDTPVTQCGSSIKYCMPNPYTAEDRKIFFISDVPHLLKTTRNCWANSFGHSYKRQLWVSYTKSACTMMYTLYQ